VLGVSFTQFAHPPRVSGDTGRAMSRENVEVVRGIYAALSRGDIEVALDACRENAVHDWSRSVGPYQGIYESRDEVRAFFGAVNEATELSFDVEALVDHGPHVIAVVGVSMRGRGSGAVAVGRGAHLWTLREGDVVSFTLFQDKEEALEAVRLRE
jgi:ketosteroid isomerase-like protein